MFHDASFGMKLTDITFSLEYIAANTGATWAHKSDIFNTETVTAANGGAVTLAYAPVAVQTNGTAYLYYKKATESSQEYSKVVANSATVTIPGAQQNDVYCVMYRYTNNYADKITISSQFIPETLHAVLTVALYAADSCNIGESTNKIGEITIDIPRFQLSGSQDLSMTSAGASQTALDGTALASGCAGCDGKATYATITKVLFDQKDANFTGVMVEDGDYSLKNGASKELNMYALFKNSVPHIVDASSVTWSSSATSIIEVNGNVAVAKASTGTATITGIATVAGQSRTATATYTAIA